MFQSVRFQHFKRFDDLEIPLSPITLIGGKNNVGKSSVLEGLFLFADRSNPNLFVRQLTWRGLSAIPLEPQAFWGPFFRNYQLDTPLSIVVKEEGIPSVLEISYSEQLEGTAVDITFPSPGQSANSPVVEQVMFPYAVRIQYSSGEGLVQTATQRFTTSGVQHRVERFDRPARGAAYIGSKMRVDAAEEAERFGKLDVEGRQDFIAQGLRAIDPRVASVSTIVLGDRPVLHADVGIGRKIPVMLLGDGTSRLLSILLALESTPGGIVLVDEIENGFHYSVVEEVWRAIGAAVARSGCQLVATTHSIECLHAATVALDQQAGAPLLSYTRLEERRDRSLHAVQASVESLLGAVELNWEMR